MKDLSEYSTEKWCAPTCTPQCYQVGILDNRRDPQQAPALPSRAKEGDFEALRRLASKPRSGPIPCDAYLIAASRTGLLDAVLLAMACAVSNPPPPEPSS